LSTVLLEYRKIVVTYWPNPILHHKTKTMAVVKVIELIASSDKGFDDAVKEAVKEASKTIRNIDSV